MSQWLLFHQHVCDGRMGLRLEGRGSRMKVVPWAWVAALIACQGLGFGVCQGLGRLGSAQALPLPSLSPSTLCPCHWSHAISFGMLEMPPPLLVPMWMITCAIPWHYPSAAREGRKESGNCIACNPAAPVSTKLKMLFVISIFIFISVRQKCTSRMMNNVFIVGINCFHFVMNLKCTHLENPSRHRALDVFD